MTIRALLTETCLSLTCLVASGYVDDQRLPVAKGLKLWLRADAGVTTNASGHVSLWRDQSGNGHDVSQANERLQPLWVTAAIHGRPALRFAEDSLSNPKDNLVASGAPRTVVLVGDADDRKGVGGCLFTFRRGIQGAVATAFMVALSPTQPGVYSDAIEGPNNARLQRAPGATVLKPFVATFAAAGTGHPIVVFLNGVNEQAVHEGGAVSAEQGPAGFTVGDRDDIFGAAWFGDIAEILVYDSLLPDTDRQQVEKYLGEKYNITIPSP